MRRHPGGAPAYLAGCGQILPTSHGVNVPNEMTVFDAGVTRELGMTNEELVRIPQNIRMGCTILKFYLDREKGDYTRALARYNGSVGRRNYSDQVLTRLANRWQYR